MPDDPKPESPDDKVVVAAYRKTRRRINIHAAVKGLRHMDYLESVVPPVPEHEG